MARQLTLVSCWFSYHPHVASVSGKLHPSSCKLCVRHRSIASIRWVAGDARDFASLRVTSCRDAAPMMKAIPHAECVNSALWMLTTYPFDEQAANGSLQRNKQRLHAARAQGDAHAASVSMAKMDLVSGRVICLGKITENDKYACEVR